MSVRPAGRLPALEFTAFMQPDILASQKGQDLIAAFWPRKLSPYITWVLVKTAITPNQTTVLWGALSVLNAWTVFAALTGRYWAIPLVPIVFQFCFVLDCVDGEIARFKNMTNPVGGKLLDGVCHRATEYALLVAYSAAAYTLTRSVVVLPIALLLVTGDAMYSYVYERRLATLRASGFSGRIRQPQWGVFQRGASWRQLSRAQKVRTITGLLHYKSVYPLIALSFAPPSIFLGGLGAVGVYKHWKWVRMLYRTLRAAADPSPAPEATGEPVLPTAATAVDGVAR